MSFEIHANHFILNKRDEDNLKKAAAELFNILKVSSFEVELIFVNEKKISKLNSDYRAQEQVTDVLSFVIEKQPLIGQIFICPPVAEKEAFRKGILPKQEILNLLIHGLVHLLGYDHQTAIERFEMEKIESLMLKKEEND